MHEIQTEELPLPSKTYSFELNSEMIQGFQKAFNWKSKDLPPTYAARSFVGMFELLNKLEVNWLGLLHISQSFDYKKTPELGQKLEAQSFLKKYRRRSQMHWLHFENVLRDLNSNEIVLTAESTILVEDRI